MKPVTVTEAVNAPAAEVFAVMSDIPNAASFIPGIKKVEVVTPTPVGVGFTWRETRVMMGKEATETMTVTHFDPPRGYAVEAKSNGVHYHTMIQVSPESKNRTLITMTFRGVPLTFGAKVASLLAFMFTGVIRKCLREDLAAVKKRCEG
jgi:carbon monoxide dehydrogenase subunit G